MSEEPTAGRRYNVLFLCTGNSARSIIAERLVEDEAPERFRGLSAGSHPKGEVHPLALELLRARGHDTAGLRSKSWDELARPGAPPLDFVITVCDAAAGESCPAWPGRPVTAHWSIEDPAAADGPLETRREAFRRAYLELERRIERLVRIPIASLDRRGLKAELDEIGATGSSGGRGG